MTGVQTCALPIFGVNKFEPTKEDELAYREVDNAAVLKAQLARLAKVKAARDPAKVAAALKALSDEGAVPAAKVAEAIQKYGIKADKLNPLYA